MESSTSKMWSSNNLTIESLDLTWLDYELTILTITNSVTLWGKLTVCELQNRSSNNRGQLYHSHGLNMKMYSSWVYRSQSHLGLFQMERGYLRWTCSEKWCATIGFLGYPIWRATLAAASMLHLRGLILWRGLQGIKYGCDSWHYACMCPAPLGFKLIVIVRKTRG